MNDVRFMIFNHKRTGYLIGKAGWNVECKCSSRHTNLHILHTVSKSCQLQNSQLIWPIFSLIRWPLGSFKGSPSRPSKVTCSDPCFLPIGIMMFFSTHLIRKASMQVPWPKKQKWICGGGHSGRPLIPAE